MRRASQPTLDAAESSISQGLSRGGQNIRVQLDDVGRDLRTNVRRESNRTALKATGALAAGVGTGATAPVAVHHLLNRNHSSERV